MSCTAANWSCDCTAADCTFAETPNVPLLFLQLRQLRVLQLRHRQLRLTCGCAAAFLVVEPQSTAPLGIAQTCSAALFESAAHSFLTIVSLAFLVIALLACLAIEPHAFLVIAPLAYCVIAYPSDWWCHLDGRQGRSAITWNCRHLFHCVGNWGKNWLQWSFQLN